MASEDLTIRMRAAGARSAARDVDRTSRSVRGLGRQTERTGYASRRAGGSIRMFSRGLRPVAYFATSAAGALGVMGLTGAARGAIAEFREARKVSRTTAAGIKSIGAGSWTSADQIGALADSIALKTGIDDEAIQTGSNLLLTFSKIRNEAGRGNDVFNRATQAAVDLSARGFGSISSASKQLGKALNDPVKGLTALNKSGVQFTDQQRARIKTLVGSGRVLGAQGIILREIEKQVGGSAAAMADPIDKLMVGIGRLAEAGGSHLFPLFAKGATVMNRFIGQVESGTGEGGRFRRRVIEIWGAIRNQLWPAIKDVARDLRPWVDGFVAVGGFLVRHPPLIKALVAAYATFRAVKFAGPIIAQFVAIGAAMRTHMAGGAKWKARGRVSGKMFGRGFIIGAIVGLATLGDELQKWATKNLPGPDWLWSSAASSKGLAGKLGLSHDKPKPPPHQTGRRGISGLGALAQREPDMRPRRTRTRGASVGRSSAPVAPVVLGPQGDNVVHVITQLDSKVVATSTHRQAIKRKATR